MILPFQPCLQNYTELYRHHLLCPSSPGARLSISNLPLFRKQRVSIPTRAPKFPPRCRMKQLQAVTVRCPPVCTTSAGDDQRPYFSSFAGRQGRVGSEG